MKVMIEDRLTALTKLLDRLPDAGGDEVRQALRAIAPEAFACPLRSGRYRYPTVSLESLGEGREIGLSYAISLMPGSRDASKLFDFLFHNRDRLPEGWKGKVVIFPGTEHQNYKFRECLWAVYFDSAKGEWEFFSTQKRFGRRPGTHLAVPPSEDD